MHAKVRIAALMESDGMRDRANVQNCVKACPKDIPLTESQAEMDWQASKQALVGWRIG